MELAAKKLEDDQITTIAADPFTHSAPLSIVRLLCHVEWLNEELERVAEERDTLRDSRYTSTMSSQLKRARVVLDDVCKELDVPRTENPVTAVRALKAECQQLRSGQHVPPHLDLVQIHKLLEFLKNAAHVYYMSNGGKIGG